MTSTSHETPDRWATEVGRMLEPIYRVVESAVEEADEPAVFPAKAVKFALDAIVEMLDCVEPALKGATPGPLLKSVEPESVLDEADLVMPPWMPREVWAGLSLEGKQALSKAWLPLPDQPVRGEYSIRDYQFALADLIVQGEGRVSLDRLLYLMDASTPGTAKELAGLIDHLKFIKGIDVQSPGSLDPDGCHALMFDAGDK